MATSSADQEAVLRAIEAWPLDDQVRLVHRILERADARGHAAPRPGWRRLAGLASAGTIPPTDEEVAQWLDEHRTDKYGH